jgi:predicted dehydrogenase
MAGSDRYDLRWLIGRKSRRAKEAGQRFGVKRTGDRLDAVLEDNDIKAVFVFTRHDSHARVALRCLEAGKAVFVEKPIALNLADAQAVRRSAQERGLPFAIGFNRRHSALAARCRSYAAARKTPIQALFRVAATYLPAEHWVYDPAVGGGRVIGEACHFIDFLRWVLGDDITGVTARGGTWTHPAHRLVDNFTATFTFASGSLGTLLYSDLGRADFPKERFELFSGETALALDDFVSLTVAGDVDASVRLDRPDKGFERELDAFADYLQTAEPGVLAGAHDGELALEWGLAIEDQLRPEDTP